MKKIAKKYGNSIVFRFSPEEVQMYGIVEGKIYDVEIAPDNELSDNNKKRKKDGKSNKRDK